MSEQPTRKPPGHRVKKSETLEVRLPHDTKQDFLTACREDGTTASEVVRESIQTYLETRLRPEPQLQTAKILTMIPQPIRKKRYLAAGVGALGLAAMIALPSAAAPDFKSVFQNLDANKDGVLSADEFGGAPKGKPGEGKNVIIEKRIIKNADGETISETETRTPADLPDGSTVRVETSGPGGAPGGTTVRIERIEKHANTPEQDAALKAGGPKIVDESLAYWLPDAAKGPGGNRMVISSHRQVSKYSDDADATPATEDLSPTPFAMWDQDHDGKVTYAEFQSAHTAMLTRGFAKLDADSNGSLSQAEYAKLADPLVTVSASHADVKVEAEPKVSADALSTAFKSLDKNADGKLSLQEYLPPA